MNGDDLINTTVLPVGLREARVNARKAKAYHVLRPYPFVAFQQWKEEDRGPLPTCRPFVRQIVEKGATWLFQKPVHFKVEDDDGLTELINQTWNDNCMGSRAWHMAVQGGLCGAVDLKWSKPGEDDRLTIDVFDCIEHTRLYFDQDDPSKLLMARIQVPQFDYSQNSWFWYREDWTDSHRVTYDRIPCKGYEVGQSFNPYQDVSTADKQQFPGEKREPNPFGIVPFWRVRNAHTGDEWGMGDLWPFFQSVDQINFQRDLGHKGNQKRIDPMKALIDLEQPENEAPDFSDAPGGVEVFQSVDGKEGRIEVVEGSHAILEDIRVFADDLKKELMQAVGSVDFDPEEITNKGNLTSAVVAAIAAPLIEKTVQKRGLYGEDGVCVFFERMCLGASNAKLSGWRPAKNVEVLWPNLVEMTEDEKTVSVNRQAAMVDKGFTTHERAVRKIAGEDGVVDVDGLVEEAEAQKEANVDESAERIRAESQAASSPE